MKPRPFIPRNAWPVVQRELRESARRRVNHRLRFWGAGAGMLVLWLIAAHSELPTEQMGIWLLGDLHAFLLGLILLIVPALTADCIAREKREGTLGLLFLTPLNAGGIVAGKAMAEGLRAFTLWLAVLPILIIPFMTGGVNWLDALTAVSQEFCAAILCLAAGLLASSMATERNTVFFLALFLAAGFVVVFGQFSILCVGFVLEGFKALKNGEFWNGQDLLFLSGLNEHARYPGYGAWSRMIARGNPKLLQIWEWLCFAGPILALVIFRAVARFAARRVERSWQDQVPIAKPVKLILPHRGPEHQRQLHREMKRTLALQRTLEWNPIAWLQLYSGKTRKYKRGLCLALLLIECLACLANPDTLESIQLFLLAILALSYTFVGVSSFLSEKRSGALELLLTTPISVNQIIYGRAWGLWKQFLLPFIILFAFDTGMIFKSSLPPIPSFTDLLLFGYWFEGLRFDPPDFPDGFFWVRFAIACGFLVLPFCATYFALRVKNLIVAALLAWVALLIPLFFAGACFLFDPGENAAWFCVVLLFSNLGLVLLVCFLLRHSLARRIYSF